MKLLKLTTIPVDEWQNGTPTGRKTQQDIFINPKYIISLVAKQGQTGTQVTVQGAMISTYNVEGHPEELAQAIEKLTAV